MWHSLRKMYKLKLHTKLLYLILIFSLISCVSPARFEDYAIASIAIEIAKEANSNSLSTNLYLKAISYFRQGEISFKNKDYGAAKKYFVKAKTMAEKAELIAYLKKTTGKGLY